MPKPYNVESSTYRINLRLTNVVATLDRMAKKKPSGDRHKPRRMVGIPERVCETLERLARDREASLSEMVKNILVDHLTKLGEWPPHKQ